MTSVDTLEGRKAQLADSIDSGEFFLSQMRTKVETLTSARDSVKSALAALEQEEKSLRVKQSKLNGLLISQYVLLFMCFAFTDRDLRVRHELEAARLNFKSAEDLLVASLVEKEQKCQKLENDIRILENRLRTTSL